ncbi:DDE-type integrase/transposase/recombinase [Croceicoccus ponticola]
MDEMVMRINGQRMHMWWAVDKEGEVLDIRPARRAVEGVRT